MSAATKGLIAGILAYVLWGLVPLYWKLLTMIPATELLYSRLVLTALTCLVVLRFRGSWRKFLHSMGNRSEIWQGLLRALLLSGNWFSFMWAVNNNQVIQSSLGYFLCPIFIVLLGRFAEKEPLNWARWIAVGLAVAGVGVFIRQAGMVPYAAICITLTWGSYSLLKKHSHIGPLVGLGLETSLLSPPVLLILVIMSQQAPLAILQVKPVSFGILLLAGLITGVPLILFSYATQRMRLSTLGMGQYIVPSGHFLLALAYGEKVNGPVLAGFALIWSALLVYAIGGTPLAGPRKAVDAIAPQ